MAINVSIYPVEVTMKNAKGKIVVNKKDYVKVVIKKGRTKLQGVTLTKVQFRKKMEQMKQLKLKAIAAAEVAAAEAELKPRRAVIAAVSSSSSTVGVVEIDKDSGLEKYRHNIEELIVMGLGIELGGLMADGIVHVGVGLDNITDKSNGIIPSKVEEKPSDVASFTFGKSSGSSRPSRKTKK